MKLDTRSRLFLMPMSIQLQKQGDQIAFTTISCDLKNHEHVGKIRVLPLL